jgi:hypothetical protein
MKYNPDKHHRQSIRLKGYDYTSAGAYFVTLCTFQKHYLFGEIVDGEMALNELGSIIHFEWKWTEVVRPTIDMDMHIVMPNHLHGIVIFGNHVSSTENVVDGGVGGDNCFPPPLPPKPFWWRRGTQLCAPTSPETFFGIIYFAIQSHHDKTYQQFTQYTRHSSMAT